MFCLDRTAMRQRPQPRSGWLPIGCAASLLWIFAGDADARDLQAVAAPLPSASEVAAKEPLRSTPDPVWLWGVGQRDCETAEPLTEAVYRNLARPSEGQRAWPIQRLTRAGSQSSRGLPACGGSDPWTGAGCAQALARWCSPLSGWLLGGRVSEVSDSRGGRATRIRLWLYEPQSGRQTVQDDYCEVCGPDLSAVIASQARALLQTAHPGRAGEPLPGSGDAGKSPLRPAYCDARPQPQGARAPTYVLWPESPGDPIASLQVDSIKVALRGLLGAGQASPLREIPYAPGAQRSAVSTLRAHLDQQNRAQWQIAVLGIELEEAGAGPTSRRYSLAWMHRGAAASERLSLSCKDSCATGLEQARGPWSQTFGRCYSDQCAHVQEPRNRPEAACLPFPDLHCAELPLPPRGARKAGLQVDKPLAARLVALTWAAAGLPLATALALGIADRAGVTLPNRWEPDRPIVGGLQPALVATAGVGAGLTAIAVTNTLLLAPSFRSPSSAPATPPLLKCPVGPPLPPGGSGE